jgi:DNA-binding CsgD family transcriptional regulator
LERAVAGHVPTSLRPKVAFIPRYYLGMVNQRGAVLGSNRPRGTHSLILRGHLSRESEPLYKCNGRAANWPLVERRKTERRQHDRRRQAQDVEQLADASRLCTSREHQAAQLVLRGMTNKQIARSLGIAEDTVKKHLHRVYMKLGVRRRALLIVERANAIEPQRSTTLVE